MAHDPEHAPTEPVDLDAIERRANAATEGPWADMGESFPGEIRNCTRFSHIATMAPDGADPEADATFIAHAREDVPALIAEIRHLRALLATKERDYAE